MTSKVPQSTIPPFGLRMQGNLHQRLKTAAATNGRSMNAEIVDRLERSFDGLDAGETLQLDAAGRIDLARYRLRQVLALLDESELAEMLR